MTDVVLYGDVRDSLAEVERALVETAKRWADASLTVTTTPGDARLHLVFAGGVAGMTEPLPDGVVVPVVADGDEAGDLPGPLNPLNAFIKSRHGPHWQDALCEMVLSRLWVPRRDRRVFISYRRADAAPVARQLFETLAHHRWQVFLDSATILVGEPFQAAQWWWLTDADLVLLLDSPTALESDFVLREIAFAKSAGVALLDVRWPDASVPPDADPVGSARVHELHVDSFADGLGSKLTNGALDDLVHRMVRERIDAVRQRWVDLVRRQVVAEEAEERKVHATALGELESTAPTDTRWIRVLPCRPDPALVLDTQAAVPPGVDEARLAYLEVAPNDPRAASLATLAARTEPGTTPPPFSVVPLIAKVPE